MNASKNGVESHMSRRILIVEDDANISRIIKMNLSLAGYDAWEINDGAEAYATINSGSPFDLILLDAMIPGMDGFELMERIKPFGIPVIFLTARNSVVDKVNGLKLGADDYMVKPFESIELLARIETVLRRYGKTDNVLSFKDVKVFPERREATMGDISIELTPKEFDLLVVLIKNKNIAISREQFLDRKSVV